MLRYVIHMVQHSSVILYLNSPHVPLVTGRVLHLSRIVAHCALARFRLTSWAISITSSGIQSWDWIIENHQHFAENVSKFSVSPVPADCPALSYVSTLSGTALSEFGYEGGALGTCLKRMDWIKIHRSHSYRWPGKLYWTYLKHHYLFGFMFTRNCSSNMMK